MKELALLMPFLDRGAEYVTLAMVVFARVAAAVAFLPGFGERALSARTKLFGAFAFTAIVLPAVAPPIEMTPQTPGALFWQILAEATAGLVIGLSVRMLILAIRTAGSIAAQATALSQLFGSGLDLEPQPAVASILSIAAIALALNLGLHVKAASAIVQSYQIVPFGVFPQGADVYGWGVEHVAAAFSIGLSLALPFTVAAFVYNVAIGAANRAMPQLMVAFIGAPAITGILLIFLALIAPFMLQVWIEHLDVVLADPLGRAR